ncbi:MAG: hypothetical protein ABW134_11725 [Candidatus Thiodiazotropha endolucinida]
MANEVQEERRRLQTFRDKVLPTLVSTAILAIAGGLVVIRDTVIKHDHDLRHFKRQCHNLETKVKNYENLVYRVGRLEKEADTRDMAGY